MPQARHKKSEDSKEFKRFESLTKRLVSVPKKDIDRKVKTENGKRKRRTT